MKKLIILLMILCMPVVMADEGLIEVYDQNEVLDLSVHLTNTTGEVEGATCKVTILNTNYTLVYEATMNEIGKGWYNATYKTSNTGKYFCVQNCTKGDLYAAETCDFIIRGDTMILAAIITVIVIAFLFLALGLLKRDYTFTMVSAITFIVIGVYIIITGLPSFDNWVANALGIVLNCIGLYILLRSNIDYITGG